MKEYQPHPISEFFPMMTSEELTSLQNDIKINGLSSPIILFEGKILDGRNRYNACLNLDIEPTYEQYTGNTPYAKVMSLNMERRNLTEGQKAIVASNILPFIKKEDKNKGGRSLENVNTGKLIVNKTIPSWKNTSIVKAAKMVGSSPTSINFVKKLKIEAPDVYDKVKSGGYSLADAKRNLNQKQNLEEYNQRIEKAKLNPQSNTFKGPYELILADPPWKYDFCKDNSDKIEKHYNTLSVEDIIKQKPNSADKSVLFLWATAPKLLEAIKVMMAWGFIYRTHAVWNKEWIGPGYWFRGQHELLLVGTKGSPSCTPETERISSIFTEKRTDHSKKPECVYQWIEKAFGDKTKLEMYCRTPRPGWSIQGNEV